MTVAGRHCGTEGRSRLARLQRRCAQERIPATGSLALTHRCNLRCVHCYLGRQRQQSAAAAGELSRDRWLSLIDECAREGCIDLLLTGGEPLLRPDFSEIYRHARRRGCLVTVFTNGTLLDGEQVALFREYPPQAVEVTLHGVTAETYERVAAVKGSFAAAMRGMRRLRDAGVRLLLKTVALRQNRGEVAAVATLARELGVPFRVDCAVFPELQGGRWPVASRLDPAEAVAVEFADAGRVAAWRAEHLSRGGVVPADESNLFVCGAGLTSFHVDPSGTLLPCPLLTSPAHRLEEGGFRRGWDGPILGLRSLTARRDRPCGGCPDQHLCGSCPALAALEDGDPQSAPAHLCELGARRRAAIETGSSI